MMAPDRRLIGAWRLVEAHAFDDSGSEQPAPIGPCPMGFAVFEESRMLGAVSDGRTALPPDIAQRIFFAYTGSYHFDGEKLETRVDGASGPELLIDQVRRIVFQTPDRWVAMPLTRLLGRDGGLELTWERVRWDSVSV